MLGSRGRRNGAVTVSTMWPGRWDMTWTSSERNNASSTSWVTKTTVVEDELSLSQNCCSHVWSTIAVAQRERQGMTCSTVFGASACSNISYLLDDLFLMVRTFYSYAVKSNSPLPTRSFTPRASAGVNKSKISVKSFACLRIF